ncbi:MFS transporter [Roseobacter sp. HKCCD9010]|uniref:MFS transporter n=1 Tax=unclassified Roseobacter TaxID=196798 RepID=UPI001491F67F|nr:MULTISPECIES: MFS transporter [unclassified Roseobacter]MBF9048925.1 MFS transporter [Rhodobacterales bacterium HKCCD4356]NNV10924.1 MFS transporter [Roseobacter sp. HKCCD7357]NNV15109.1 MFS transporter [Roseobacter sp. HKCCD8768]NNV24568.1 MFS transporter [Roseobacter sp. HKCCD8192]NNV28825.1 MFS transporter [Roseobacter sp. HKCCD9061]
MRLIRDPAILALMGMQITVWAGLFYSFPALVLEWQAEFGWRSPEIMGAFTLAIAIYALGAPLYGRLIDRGAAPLSLPLGTVMGAGLLLGLTGIETLWAFYLIWAAMGVIMGLSLYEATFAIVTRAKGPAARQAITAITLVGGFASTLAYPLSHWLTEIGGWRLALYAFAALNLVLAAPLAVFAATRLERDARTAQPQETEDVATPPARLLRRSEYWLVAIGFAASALTLGIFVSHLLPIMAAQGVPDDLAILAAALIGPSQVIGRIAMMAAGPHIPAIRIAQLAMGAVALGAVMMAAAGWVAGVVLLFGFLQGAGHGVVGIMRPVVAREVFGQRDFGAISGAVATPYLLLFALAPFLGAALFGLAGYGPVLILCVLAPLAGAVLLNRLLRN